MTPTQEAGRTLATQVARLFFDGQLSKVEIGDRLGISRFRVARLLDQARRTGLVKIEYRDAPERDLALAREIERRWELDLCVVVAADGDGVDAAARSGAEVVADLLASGTTVGIAWGSTLAAMVDHVPSRMVPGLTVVPLAGGSAAVEHGRGPAALARGLAERMGGLHRELYAPAFVASPAVRDALAGEAEVADVLAAYADLEMAVIGIGAWSADGDVAGSSLLASGALSVDERRLLRDRGAVGELVVHPFDAAGAFVAPDLEARSIAIGVDRLRAVKRVVAVAAGAGKGAAIRAALRTGVIDVLVTDSAAAAAAIEDPEATS